MIRTVTRIAGATAFTLMLAVPASAQVVQSLQFGIGGFYPRGFDGRSEGDVLVENLITSAPLLFDIKDFKGATVFGEWNVAFGNHLEVGAGLGYYKRTVPSIYADIVNELPNGDLVEIEQDLSLRIVPVSGVVRFLPFGRQDTVQPYVGAGISALNWRYTEIGQFVDFGDPLDDFDDLVFDERYIGTGTTVAPLLLGGVRFPIKGDIYGLTLEYRYQFGEGDLPRDVDFLSDRIDLSGGSFTVGFLVRF
jgi:hypothetical protein